MSEQTPRQTLDERIAESKRSRENAARVMEEIAKILEEIAERNATEAHENEGGQSHRKQH